VPDANLKVVANLKEFAREARSQHRAVLRLPIARVEGVFLNDLGWSSEIQVESVAIVGRAASLGGEPDFFVFDFDWLVRRHLGRDGAH